MSREETANIIIDEHEKNVEKLNHLVKDNVDVKVSKDDQTKDPNYTNGVIDEDGSKIGNQNTEKENFLELAENKNGQDTNNRENDEKRAELEKSAYNLLAEGNKRMLLKDYSESVTLLGEACEKFVELYGELNPKCGQVYYSYGCACLLLGQEEITLLGGGSGSESKKEKLVEKSTTVVDGGEPVAGTSGVAIKRETEKRQKEYEDDDDDDDDDDDENSEEQEESDQEVIEDNGDAEENLSDGEEAEDNEVADEEYNFQVAWESLECARKIFHEQKDDAKLADCYLKLGEVSVMTGNYQTAIDDMNTALRMRQASLASDSRIIAEVHFHLALAYNLNNQFDEAIEQLEFSRDVLRLRISNIQKSKGDNDDNDAMKEIDDIEAILKNIEEKFVEFNTGKEAVVRGLEDLLKVGDPDVGTSSSNKSDQPAKDISHLVRKKVPKRKSSIDQDEQVTEDRQSKKLCATSSDDIVEKLSKSH